MRRFASLAAAAALMLTTATGAPAAAQDSSAPTTQAARVSDAALNRGNAHYNNSEYEEARAAYVDAIQADPTRSAPYRNLARAYFWLSRFSAAVAYYDHYLRLAATAADVEQVKSERRLASERARDAVYTLQDNQRLPLEALNRELDSGQAYTHGGGGAWALFQTLLRTGYAEPNLAPLRARLARRIADELEAGLLPGPGQLAPVKDLSEWQLQNERAAAARSIADDPALAEVIDRRATAVEAAIAMLTGREAEAAELARLARASNPDLGYLVWFEASALVGAEKYDEALTLLTKMEEELDGRQPERLQYIRLLQAIALQRFERPDEAGGLYLEVLRP